MVSLFEAPPLATAVFQIVGAVLGILLLIGLWTPVAGALTAVVKMGIAISRYFSASDDLWTTTILAALGAALAMIGPGAWSIDARLFGRKHIEFPERR